MTWFNIRNHVADLAAKIQRIEAFISIRTVLEYSQAVSGYHPRMALHMNVHFKQYAGHHYM